jgi:type II secretory pathway pseudopilin PulG
MQNAERKMQNVEKGPGAAPLFHSEFCILRSAFLFFRIPPRARTSQQGFTLASLLVILTVIAVLLAYTVPPMWSDIMKRERDIQTAWVVKQYARAIYEFQKKRGTWPVSLEQLKEQNTPRIIRQLYPNPLSGEMDWVLLPPGTVPAVATPISGLPSGQQPNPVQVPTGPPATGLSGQQSGPFVGVRPPNTGKAYVSINGSEEYESWVYTAEQFAQELQQRLAGGAAQGQGTGRIGTGVPRPGASPRGP